MPFNSSILCELLKPLDRRHFASLVERFDADAYDKRFSSWQHLVALVYAQISGAASLRAIETGFNAQPQQHFHLNCGKLSRSTLADANARRPVALFSAVFESLLHGLGRKQRSAAQAGLQLIDSTPIPLGRMFDWPTSNGHLRGLKLHVLHDLQLGIPGAAKITAANVNDLHFGTDLALEAGVTYVFDKAYCDYAWWTKINETGAFFVTRPKTNLRWKSQTPRSLGATLEATQGDGFVVLADHDVMHQNQGNATLAMPLRRITIKREQKQDGKVFDIISNDMQRSAVDIAACYKARWQIELFFKWIKQNLNIKSFIARNENAVRLQILAAMIAYVLVAIARKTAVALSQKNITLRRFIELLAACLHTRRNINQIEKPPPIHPSKAKPRSSPLQMELNYA
jgi:putative transposase